MITPKQLGEMLKNAAANIGNLFDKEVKVTILIRRANDEVGEIIHGSDVVVTNDEFEMIISSIKYLSTREQKLQ